MLSTIVKNLKTSQHFAIQANDVPDVSGWVLLGLSLRYVKNNQPAENRVQFVAFPDVAGAVWCSEIRAALKTIGVEEANRRTQGYDGAEAMSGHFNGCQKHFKVHVPLAHQYYSFK